MQSTQEWLHSSFSHIPFCESRVHLETFAIPTRKGKQIAHNIIANKFAPHFHDIHHQMCESEGFPFIHTVLHPHTTVPVKASRENGILFCRASHEKLA